MECDVAHDIDDRDWLQNMANATGITQRAYDGAVWLNYVFGEPEKNLFSIDHGSYLWVFFPGSTPVPL